MFYCAWEFVSPEKDQALLTLVTMRQRETPFLILRLKGLDPEKYYQDADTGEIYSGALLMNAGINLTPRDGGMYSELACDGGSLIKYFIEQK